MRAEYYAQALWELESAGKVDKNMLTHFVGTVKKNGHAHLLPKISRALENITEKAEKRQTIEVISGDDLSEGAVATLLKNEPFKHALTPKHKKVLRKKDESLIGGTVVRTSDTRIDNSYKRALLDLYQSLIT
jgi:F0F1-type ATP synthase delta subunit